MRKVRARKTPRSEKPRTGPGAPAARRTAPYAGRDRQPPGGVTPTGRAAPLSADARELDEQKDRPARFGPPSGGAERQGWGETRPRASLLAAPRRPGSLPSYDGLGRERPIGFAGRVGNYGARFEAGQLAGIGLAGSSDCEYVGWGRYGLARTR